MTTMRDRDLEEKNKQAGDAGAKDIRDANDAAAGRPDGGSQVSDPHGDSQEPVMRDAGINRYKPSVWLDILAFIGVFFVANMVGAAVSFVMKLNGNENADLGMFVAYTVAMALTLVFAVWQRKRRGASKPLLKFSLKKADPTLVLWGVVLVMVTSVVLEPLLMMFPDQYLENLYDAIGVGGWAIMTSIVAAPILEEILFRGILQESLTEKFGGWRGVLLTAAIFGFVHLVPQQVVNSFFIGVILGYIYIKTHSIIPVIIIHAINNAVAFIQIVIFDKGMVTTRQMISNDIVYWIVYGALCIVFVVAAVNLRQQLRRIPSEDAAVKI